MKKVVSIILCIASVFMIFFGCAKPKNEDGIDKINLLVKGWNNTPTSADDPFKNYIKQNYKLDVALNANSDFDNACIIGFNSNDKPDLISFPDYATFKKFEKQGVLLDDWTPYLDKMPNIKKIIDDEGQKFVKNIFTKDSKLMALWTVADPPIWSLKLREDWLIEFRAQKSYKADWSPKTPDQLLEFARWIKTAKNLDQNNLDVFAFTSAGNGNSLGTLGTWLPLMFGAVSIAPWGFYTDAQGNVQFSTTDGTYKKMLDFLKTIQEEKLIEPVWFSQAFSDKKRSYKGKIGIEWLPGVVSDYTQSEFNDKDGNALTDTLNWWTTYDLPVDPEATNEIAGNMPGTGLAGKVITVSKKASLNANKMDKICKLINDTYSFYDRKSDSYLRGAAYDALRWGVGIEDGIEYEKVPNSNLVYCNTSSVGAGLNTKYYREKQVGAWDWGSWFSSTNDGVIQGSKKGITPLVLKVASHDIKTAQMKTRPQIGAYLDINTVDLNEMVYEMVSFEYSYASSGWDSSKAKTEYDKFITKWNTNLKGEQMLKDAKKQFTAMGIIKTNS